MTARAGGAVSAALAGEPGPVAFFPYIWELAAQRAGTTLEQLAESASRCVAAVTDASRLLATDAVFVPCSPGTASVETVGRLSEMRLGKDVAACVAGPQRLLHDGAHGDVDDACDATEDLARAVLEAGCTVMVLDESSGTTASSPAIYRVLAKLCAYYGARSLAVAPLVSAEVLLDGGIDAVDSGWVAGTGRCAVAPATRDGVPDARLVTSSFVPRPTEADAAWLMAVGRQLREHRHNTVEA